MVLFSLMFMAVIANDFVVNAEVVDFAKMLHLHDTKKELILGRNEDLETIFLSVLI